MKDGNHFRRKHCSEIVTVRYYANWALTLRARKTFWQQFSKFFALLRFYNKPL